MTAIAAIGFRRVLLGAAISSGESRATESSGGKPVHKVVSHGPNINGIFGQIWRDQKLSPTGTQPGPQIGIKTTERKPEPLLFLFIITRLRYHGMTDSFSLIICYFYLKTCIKITKVVPMRGLSVGSSMHCVWLHSSSTFHFPLMSVRAAEPADLLSVFFH